MEAVYIGHDGPDWRADTRRSHYLLDKRGQEMGSYHDTLQLKMKPNQHQLEEGVQCWIEQQKIYQVVTRMQRVTSRRSRVRGKKHANYHPPLRTTSKILSKILGITGVLHQLPFSRTIRNPSGNLSLAISGFSEENS